MEAPVHVCHRCGAPWDAVKRQPGIKEVCESCNAYLHCCKNCRFYDTSAHNSCRVPNTDWVNDKDKANFCDEFEFHDGPQRATEGHGTDQARDALEGLFGGTLKDDESGPKDFDSLFGD